MDPASLVAMRQVSPFLPHEKHLHEKFVLALGNISRPVILCFKPCRLLRSVVQASGIRHTNSGNYVDSGHHNEWYRPKIPSLHKIPWIPFTYDIYVGKSKISRSSSQSLLEIYMMHHKPISMWNQYIHSELIFQPKANNLNPCYLS